VSDKFNEVSEFGSFFFFHKKATVQDDSKDTQSRLISTLQFSRKLTINFAIVVLCETELGICLLKFVCTCKIMFNYEHILLLRKRHAAVVNKAVQVPD